MFKKHRFTPILRIAYTPCAELRVFRMAIGGSLASTSIRTAISEPAFWPGAAHGAALGPTAQSTSDGGATMPSPEGSKR